jgi:hypothetical protein
MTRQLLIALAASVLSLIGAGCAHHTPRPNISLDLRLRPTTDSAVYQQLVQRAKAGDKSVDYAQLRFLFARLPEPHLPIDGDSLLAHARRAASNEAARAALDSLLDDYYGSTSAHELAVAVLRTRGDSTGVHTMGAVLERFVHSMDDRPGAGKTMALPIDVVSVSEEYTYLRARGYRRSGMQSDMICDRGECDELEVTEISSGKTLNLYFRWARRADRPSP